MIMFGRRCVVILCDSVENFRGPGRFKDFAKWTIIFRYSKSKVSEVFFTFAALGKLLSVPENGSLDVVCRLEENFLVNTKPDRRLQAHRHHFSCSHHDTPFISLACHKKSKIQ